MTLPKEFCAQMAEMLGGEYDDFIRSYDTEINLGIRVNTLKCSDAAQTAAELGASGRVAWCPDGYYADRSKISGNHPYHAAGMFYFQEPSAMSAAEGLPLCENPRILDLCAAPGGKTTHIAARMGNKGLLVSNELVPKRALILSGNVERMGLTNTIVTNESPTRLAAKFPSFFDGIIVDAPYSGEGMFRKEPQAIDAWSIEHTLSCAARQKNILDDAYKMLKHGGYIMYSTCTFAYEENEAVVLYMAEKYGMEICDIPPLSMLSPGLGGAEKCRRIFPHRHDGEGHFAALLRKTEPDPPRSDRAPIRKKSKRIVNTALSDAVKCYREFEKDALRLRCDGEFVLFGDNLYLIPEHIDVSGVKIPRCGLHLGTVRRGGFRPAHALSHAFAADAYRNVITLDRDSAELGKYMRGEIINSDTNGYCVIAVNGCGVGWGKASGGTVKNHYPKALRTLR